MTEQEYNDLKRGDIIGLPGSEARYTIDYVTISYVDIWSPCGIRISKEAVIHNYDLIKKDNNMAETNTKEIKIDIPDGYEIDKENSTFECIKFKKIEKKLPTDLKDLEYEDGYYEPISIRGYVSRCFYDEPGQYNRFKTQKEAEAYVALGKLIQLRDAWVGDWEPNWNDNEYKYIIENYHNEVNASSFNHSVRPLAFPTKEMRDKFLDTFRDLIKQAKMFI